MMPVPREKQTQAYWNILNRIIDPELNVGIVDLGLIYDVIIKDGVASVVMTLTSIGCPAGPEFMRRVESEMGKYPGVKDVRVNLVWEPAWNKDFIKEDVREILF